MQAAKIAFLVYILGIGLAVSGAAKVPQAGQAWPDTVPIFVAGTLLGCLGLLWWRAGLITGATDPAKSDQDLADMLRHVRDCRDRAGNIRQELTTLDGDALRQKIDNLLLDHIEPVVENRFALVRHYGMKDGAEIMLKLSLAERNLNRVWSAAADSCLPEAHASFGRALDALEQLQAEMESGNRGR